MSYCDNIVLYVYNELTETERSAFEAHLKSCSDCQAALSDYKDVLNTLGKLPELEPARLILSAEPHYHRSRVILRWSAVAAGFICVALVIQVYFTNHSPFGDAHLKPAVITAPTEVSLPARGQVTVENAGLEWDNGVDDDITAVSDRAEIFNWDLTPTTKHDNMDKSLSDIKDKIEELNSELESDIAGF